MLVADRLSAQELRAELGPGTIGRQIIVLEETTSTNDVVWQMAKDGAPEGIVVFAEQQSAGRGQRGNTWESAAGKGLWFSVLLRPKTAISDPVQLAQQTAQIVATTIQSEFHFGRGSGGPLPKGRSLRHEILHRFHFFQPPPGFNLFACHRVSPIHLAGQTGHEKPRRRFRIQQVVLWSGLPASENSHDRF